MSERARTGEAHARCPAERFYWAVLDASILPGSRQRRPSHAQLAFLFENVVPVPIEELAIAFARCGRTRWIACGVEKSVVHNELHSSAITLTPASIPEFLLEHEVDPSSLNILRGDLAPVKVKRSRRNALAAGLVGLLLCASLFIVGMERRAAHARDMAAAAIEQREALAHDVVGDTGVQRAELALLAELRQLRQRAGRGGAGCASHDLVDLIQHWPQSMSGSESRPRLISITPGSAIVQARLRTMADANRFAAAFETGESLASLWQSGPPNIRSAAEPGGAFDVSVTLTRGLAMGGRE